MAVSGNLITNVEFGGKVQTGNPRSWMLTVRVNLKAENEKPVPYVGTVECIGIFTVLPAWPEDQIEKLVLVNGTGLIYTIIREMICSITARGPFDVLMLPTQSFLDFYEQRKKAGAGAGAATTSAT